MNEAPDISLVSCRLSNRSTDFPPIGILYLASALAQAGLTAEVIDHQVVQGANPFDPRPLVQTLASCRGRVVGISLFANALPLVLSSARQYMRETDAPKPLLLGGPGVNGIERRLLERFSEIHSIVRGEGEVALVEVLRAIARDEVPTGPGIYTRDASGSVIGTPPVRISDLDALPWPDRQALTAHVYARTPLLTARGCPFACTFCDIITMWGRRVGFRSTDDVIREIAHVVQQTGQPRIDFIDDTFTVHPKRVRELCREIVGAGLQLRWSCFARIDTLSEDLMSLMAEAGCTSIFVGIETGSESMWKSIKKRLQTEQVVDAVGSALNYFNVTASYIWGYPDERFSDFAETIELAARVENLPRRQHLLLTQLHFLSPTVSTPIYERWGETLLFDEHLPLDLCGGKPLAAFRGMEGYDTCVDLIRGDRALFAPFYHYPSEHLDKKLSIMVPSRALLGMSVGGRRTRLVRSPEGSADECVSTARVAQLASKAAWIAEMASASRAQLAANQVG